MLLVSRRTFVLSTAALAVARPSLVRAATTHEVQMLNVNPDDPKQRMVFYPHLLTIQPGDTVKFVATDKSHNSVSIDEMIPEGAEGWEGKINEEVDVTFDQPGFYGYQCVPHTALGMVGLIVVEGDGKLDNLEAAQAVKHRGKAKQVFEQIWAEAEAEGLTN